MEHHEHLSSGNGNDMASTSRGDLSNDVIVSQQHDYHDKRLFFIGDEDKDEGGPVDPVNFDNEGGTIAAGKTVGQMMMQPETASEEENAIVTAPVPVTPTADDEGGERKINENSIIKNNITPRKTFASRLQQKVHEHFFRSKDDASALSTSTTTPASSRTEDITASNIVRSDPPASQVSDSTSVLSSLPPLADLTAKLQASMPEWTNISNVTTTDDSGYAFSAIVTPPRRDTVEQFVDSAPPPSTAQAKAAYEVLAKLQANYDQNINMKRSVVTSPSLVSQEEEVFSNASQSQVRFELNDPKADIETLKREKSIKWKQKMRIAQEKKRREQKGFDDASNQGTSNALGMAGKALISCVLAEVQHANLLKTLTTCGGDVVDGEDSVYAYSEAESGSSRSFSGSEEDDESNPKSRGRSKRREGKVRRQPSVDSSNASSTLNPSTVCSTTVTATEASVTPSRNASRMNRQQEQGPVKTVLSSDNVSQPPTDVAAYNGMIGEGSMRHDTTTGRGRENSVKNGPSFAKAFIAKMEHIGARMLWHRETSVMNPATVVMFLKKGHRCSDGTHCGPRLVWSEVKEDSVNGGQNKRIQGRTYSVDMFDIASVQRADPLQLENFPFAIPGRTICVNLKTDGANDRLIFEGTSQDDAGRVLRGLRLVVARMARNLVMGNMEVGCELLDLADENRRLGKHKGSDTGSTVRSPRSAMEFDWSRAMDDATEKLLDSALQTD